MKISISELNAMPAQEVLEKLSGQIPNWPEISRRHFRPNSLKRIAIEEYAKSSPTETLKPVPKEKPDAKAPETHIDEPPARPGNK